VNTPLLRLTPDADGLDRFWISSYNGAFGSLGVCVNERGECRLYSFGSHRHPGFYSAVQTGPDTLWLCGNLAQVVRLDLKSGRFKAYETGAPSALVFAGMAYNKETGKLFFVAYPPPRTLGVSFDIESCRTVRIYELPTLDHYQRSSYAHADGTHTVELQCPGLTMARWNPREESVTLFPVRKELDLHGPGNLAYQMIADDDGRLYMPNLGWYDPKTGTLGDGPRPADDTVCWFDRDATFAYGLKTGTSLLRRWNLKTGEVRDIGDYSGAELSFMTTRLTRSGKLVTVSRIGIFNRLDPATGELELSRPLPTDAVQPADCVIRIDRDRILGTPFITQRFWEANLRTGKGFDCGAAAPGSGEILRVWRLGGRIYMAAYTGGELMEYDPSRHPHFPENPRVVAKPPTGMRPVASADDGRRIFYACSHHYGHLGSVMTGYDTRTGLAHYRDNPLPDQQIISLCYEKKSDSLLAGTTYEADCSSAPAATNQTVLARLDARTFEPIQTCPGPENAMGARLIGPLGPGRWLGTCWGRFGDQTGARWFVFDSESFRAPESGELQTFSGCQTMAWHNRIRYAGTPGHFVVKADSRIELWDMRRMRRLKVFADSMHVCDFFIQGRDLLIWTAWDVFVLERALA
jgi:streptogramin lyase